MKINSLLNMRGLSHSGGTIKNSLSIAKNATLAFALSTAPIATATNSFLEIPKASIYTKAKPIFRDYVSEHPSFYVYELVKSAIQTDINTGLFNRSLRENKKQLMKELKINSKTYDSYVELTKVIGQDERGVLKPEDPGCYEIFNTNFFDATLSTDYPADFKSVYKDYKPYVPVDMERFVVKDPTESEKFMFLKHGINFDDEKLTPQKRAIATVIHLANLDKEYPQYLKEVSKLRPDCNDKSVMASIRNAERILSDEILGPFAVAELDAAAREMSFIMGDIGEIEFNLLSKKDLDDLRIYASSIVLSKEAYLLERWDNHPVIPKGDKRDSACANILSMLLEKTE